MVGKHLDSVFFLVILNVIVSVGLLKGIKNIISAYAIISIDWPPLLSNLEVTQRATPSARLVNFG